MSISHSLKNVLFNGQSLFFCVCSFKIGYFALYSRDILKEETNMMTDEL